MGDVIETIIDPIGSTIADAIGVNSPLDYAFSAPWDYPEMMKSDWRVFKHLLIPDMRRDREVTTNDSLQSRRLIYGRARVGIQLAYACSTGDKSQYLSMIGIFCGHGVDAIEEIWLGDKRASDSAFSGYLTYQLYDGSQTEACAAMISDSGGLWTSEHKLLGCSYIYIKLTYNEAAFPNGLPIVKAIIKGRRVYDPRTGITAWSDNSALCSYDYMMLPAKDGGMGCSADEVDVNSVITAANYCDEVVL